MSFLLRFCNVVGCDLSKLQVITEGVIMDISNRSNGKSNICIELDYGKCNRECPQYVLKVGR